MRQKEAADLIAIIEDAGFEARFAGGCVRDRVLNITPKDYDIATSANPNDICTIFKQKNFKTVPTGIDHGTITVVMKHSAYEVTTLRKDVNTDGRHAQVEFGNSFEDDAERRDFTINAMFEDRSGRIYDFFDGKKHLEAKELHFVGDAKLRMQEDYLRILRLFRFWARFNCTPNKQTLQAVEELGAGLRQISQERISSELLGLLESQHLQAPLQAMFDSQIMLMILPEAKTLSADHILNTKAIYMPFRGIVRLSLLLHEVVDPAQMQSIARKLKLSKKQEQILLACNVWGQAIGHIPAKQSNFMALADQCDSIVEGFFLKGLIPAWKLLYPDQLDIISQAEKTEETKRYLRNSSLPLDTKEIMVEFNLIPGPKLGEVKDALITSFRDELWHTRDEGLKWLRSHIDAGDA